MSDTTGSRRDKHLILDQGKLRKAQKILGAKTETETVERALDFVIGEDERSRMAWAAHDRFMQAAMREGLLIHDAFGRLGERSGKGVN
ncbi:MAG TPA: hypothetical protein VFS10_22870 [Pyrinomonadaceae bacterium]|nr:hypothetical protein [Pyrinomonadaceae bacterium]